MVGTTQNDRLYNALDTVCAHKIHGAINDDYQKDYGFLDDKMKGLLDVLLYMSVRGVRYDVEAVKTLASKIEHELEEAQQELYSSVGFQLNANSNPQCKKYFYETLSFAPYKHKGTITTNDKALARLARRGAIGAKQVQTVRRLVKFKGTYVDIIPDDDGRFRCSWNPRGTVTGRVSSSQTIFGTGSNMQNLDPRLKSFFLADEGNLFIELDKAKAEWVVAAYVSGDARMIEAVESGKDIHAVTGAEISGLTYEEVLEEDKLLGKVTNPDELHDLRTKHLPSIFRNAKGYLPRLFTARQAGKKSNHALNYMEEYRRFALENEMPETDAKEIVERYRYTYPGLVDWWRRIDEKLRSDRTLVNCFGMPRIFLGELDRAGNTPRGAIAHIPQSTVGYIINFGLVEQYRAGLDESIRDREIINDIDLLVQVHDSELTQYPVTNFSKMATAIQFMRSTIDPKLEANGREFRIATDMKVGLNWGDYHKTENSLGMRSVPLHEDIALLAKCLEAEYDNILRSSKCPREN